MAACGLLEDVKQLTSAGIKFPKRAVTSSLPIAVVDKFACRESAVNDDYKDIVIIRQFGVIFKPLYNFEYHIKFEYRIQPTVS